MQEGIVVVWGGLINSWEKKKSEKHGREGKVHPQLNVEFQRIARRDKKDFFNEQCLEIEKDNRKGKTRDCFKKRNISSKDGHDKGRNVKDITEAEEIKKKWQEYTEEKCI